MVSHSQNEVSMNTIVMSSLQIEREPEPKIYVLSIS